MSTGLLSDASPRSIRHTVANTQRESIWNCEPWTTARLSLFFFFFLFFILFTDEVQTTILGLVRILPDTWGHSEDRLWNDRLIPFFFLSFAAAIKSKISIHIDQLKFFDRFHHGTYVRDYSERPLCIWVNPSITCLTLRHLHKCVHINHWDYKNISSYVMITIPCLYVCVCMGVYIYVCI